MTPYRRLIESIAAEGLAALARIEATAGSTPREKGAAIVVRPSGGFHGTIGGGALEWRALEAARGALAEGRGARRRFTFSLGPDLAQCCGGRVDLSVEVFDARDLDDLEARAKTENPEEQPTLLFGAGHVGRALALALAPLPFAVRWIDPRPDAFPPYVPQRFAILRTQTPVEEISRAPDGAFILVMTHSHPLDLALVAEALRQARFSYVGMIGSQTKRARFVSQMRAAGLDDSQLEKLVCPIGVPGISGKSPAVIAIAVAAQMLMRVESLSALRT
jgi:xanthine dehydrogenase accessory factor